MTTLPAHRRVRFAAAQRHWDNLAEPDYDDGVDERLIGIEEARRCLDAAARHVERGELALADQCMADAVGYLVP